MRHVGGGRGSDGRPKKQETGEMSGMWSKGDDRSARVNGKASCLHKHKNTSATKTGSLKNKDRS